MKAPITFTSENIDAANNSNIFSHGNTNNLDDQQYASRIGSALGPFALLTTSNAVIVDTYMKL